MGCSRGNSGNTKKQRTMNPLSKPTPSPRYPWNTATDTQSALVAALLLQQRQGPASAYPDYRRSYFPASTATTPVETAATTTSLSSPRLAVARPAAVVTPFATPQRTTLQPYASSTSSSSTAGVGGAWSRPSASSSSSSSSWMQPQTKGMLCSTHHGYPGSNNHQHHHAHHPATTNTTTPCDYTYRLVVLERTTAKWGLRLALTPDGHVAVAASRSAGVQAVAWQTVASTAPCWWWKNHTAAAKTAIMMDDKTNETTSRTTTTLEQFFGQSHAWNPVPFDEALGVGLPGDTKHSNMIVAMNGTVIQGPCNDLEPVLNVFRTQKRLHVLVVQRQPQTTRTTAMVVPQQTVGFKKQKALVKNNNTAPKQPFVLFRNELFRDPDNPSLGQPYADDLEFEIDEGKRSALFLAPINDVTSWIQRRKRKWRTMYTIRIDNTTEESAEQPDRDLDGERHVAVDFWTPQGFVDLGDWMRQRKMQWRQSYSWHRAKRQRIQQDVEELQAVVNIQHDFATWLRVRKTQWRLARRQRQRALAANVTAQASASTASSLCADVAPSLLPDTCVDSEVLVLDSLLAEKEERERKRKERAPINISWLFDGNDRCPDDVVVHCLRFLDFQEHGTLMALNRDTRAKLAKRDAVWRLLCPPHWTLPRRPRQPWHVLYWTKLKTEHLEARKRGDELLTRALNIVAKGDHLSSLERLVKNAEKDGHFDVNYSSGVVCERNSLLNLAVIHGRHKITRWLVESKGADIESEDRGQFTPLLNAAWEGDKVLVRFFLAHGADRKHVGMSHYTRALSPFDFEGRTAAEWAEFRGHSEVAKLIRLGL